MDKKENHIYIAIDLKSFYASVECQERGVKRVKEVNQARATKAPGRKFTGE